MGNGRGFVEGVLFCWTLEISWVMSRWVEDISYQRDRDTEKQDWESVLSLAKEQWGISTRSGLSSQTIIEGFGLPSLAKHLRLIQRWGLVKLTSRVRLDSQVLESRPNFHSRVYAGHAGITWHKSDSRWYCLISCLTLDRECARSSYVFCPYYPRMNVHCGVTLEPEEYSAPFLLAVFSHVKCYIKHIQPAHIAKVPGPCCHPHRTLFQGTHTQSVPFGERVDTVSGLCAWFCPEGTQQQIRLAALLAFAEDKSPDTEFSGKCSEAQWF